MMMSVTLPQNKVHMDGNFWSTIRNIDLALRWEVGKKTSIEKLAK